MLLLTIEPRRSNRLTPHSHNRAMHVRRRRRRRRHWLSPMDHRDSPILDSSPTLDRTLLALDSNRPMYR